MGSSTGRIVPFFQGGTAEAYWHGFESEGHCCGDRREDGRMGAAYVSLSDKLPARSFVVLGPPSAMRAEAADLVR